jgi:Zn-dependent protease with chaperone function
MIHKANAVFYDGESSVAQKTVLFLDIEKGVLFFDSLKNEEHNWKITDITCTQSGQILNLQHGNNPVQNIKVEDSDFVFQVTLFRKKNGHVSGYQKLIDLGFKWHLALALLLLVGIGLSYIYVIPWAAEKSVVLIPKEYDDDLGNLFFEQNMVFSDIDIRKSKALNLFAKELKLNNSKKLKFTVVNSDIVNAFALPDGNIVVFSGILDAMKTHDELVGLLGHEVAHVNNRHSMKMLCRNLSGYLFVSAILGDANGVMAVIGDNVNTLQSLSFSRAFEHQADLEGFEIVKTNRINPQGMLKLFSRLQEEDNGISVPEFLSSHPVTAERIKFIKKRIQTNPFPYKDNSKLKVLFQEIKQ